MAFNSQIKGYMTFGKSFSRGGAFPLEAYEIWTDYDALVAYAANTDPSKDPSYIGQKVAYVDLENNKVTHYGIEIDGTLKELGASPIGDEKSIVIGDDNTISLKGIDGLTFERDILGEDDQPTGQKENVQFQPLMTKDGLIWVEPSKTTVEGLASLIDGLTARVSALENDRVTEAELAAAVKVETDRATAAEEALGQRIDAIDFVDADELATAISDVEAKIPTNNNQLENGAGYQTADDVSTAITNGIANKADKADTLAGYGITDAYTKTEVDTELAKKAAQTDLEALEGRVDAFLTGTGATDALDSLQELITYINEHDDVELADIIADVEALQTKVDTGDQKVSEYVTAAIAALKIGDYAKAADLTALASRVEALEAKPFDTYATKTEVGAVDAKFKDVVAKSDFETFQTNNTQAIDNARTGAVSDVEAKGYAIASEVEADLAEKVDAGTIVHTSDGVTEGVTRDSTTLNIVIDTYKKSETYTKDEVNTAITNKIGEMTGGESAADVLAALNDYKKANDAEIYGSDKVASWTDAEGKYTPVYSQDSRLDSLDKAVATAQAQADKSVSDAATAKGIADQNKVDLGTLQTNFENIVTKADTGLVAKVSALETKDTELAGSINGIDATVKGHTTTITEHGTKIVALENKDTELAALIKGNTDKFADYSTTAQMNSAIEAAIAGADLSTYAKVTDVEAIYKAGVDGGAATGVLAEEIARATAAEKANSDAITALIGEDTGKTIRAIAGEETAKIVAGADAKYDTLKEIADFIVNDETGAAAMANDIAALKGTVGDAESGLVKAVADNTAAIAAIIQPKASAEVTVDTDGTLGIGQVNVNKLVQTEGEELILNGGNATL